MATPTSTLGKFFHGLATLYRAFRAVVLNGLFILLVLLFLGSLVGQPPVIVERGSALLVNPNGTLVDQLTFVDPLDAVVTDSLGAEDQRGEVLLQDLLDAIDLAAEDDDIAAMVLVPGNLQPSGFSKLQEVGRAIDRFRASGKKVYAYGDSFTQGQYYLAARADEVILNAMGAVNLEGFSTYQYYYRDALDKLGVNVHVFRVGEYKSAVEPYVRNDMSPEAREANRDWLGDLWQQYVADVTGARSLEPGFLESFINNLDDELAQYQGDTAQLANASNLVDALMDRSEVNAYLRQAIGSNGNGNDFLHIDYDAFLAAHGDRLATRRDGSGHVGLVVASGQIYDGRRKAGEIGGDSLQDLIRLARLDDDIKALVLRIDSGGGSAFASEIIRSELEKFRDAGKPLVVSMGSVAASGGYWIATPADEIWASASTITGSIGIFGLYPSFEGSFPKLGLHADGIGTTDLAGALTVGRPLPDKVATILQLQLEDGYNRFINLVADSRDMSTQDVDAIARGRVWSGMDALDLGLVDKLGSLDEAAASAAALAGLEDADIRLIEQPLTPGQQLIQDLAGNVLVRAALDHLGQASPTLPMNVLSGFYRTLNDDLKGVLQFNDPNGLYLQCHECRAVLSP